MIKIISMIILFASSISIASISALKCHVSGDLVDDKLQTRNYYLAMNSGSRKIAFLFSEETNDKMATYNTTVNLYFKIGANGIQNIEVKAWPQGNATVVNFNNKKVSILTPSRISSRIIKNEMNCEIIAADYYLVSQYTFENEDYLNISDMAISSFIGLAQNSDELLYPLSISRAKSLSGFASSQFCYVGAGDLLLNDLKSSVREQIDTDLKNNPSPLFWERSGFSSKTLSPMNLKLNTDGNITWSQPRETKSCSKSHSEIIYNDDLGIDETIEVCDEYVLVLETSQLNNLQKCKN